MSIRVSFLWALSVSTAACGAGGDSAAERVEVGHRVPAYAAVTAAGDSVSLAARRGKVVLLNVWATWCHPCRAEIPELIALNKRYSARGLDVVGVTVDAAGADADVRQFVKDFNMDYHIWFDPADRVSTRFLLVGVPTTFVVDREGVLLWRKTGPIQPGDTSLTGVLERALGG